MKKNLIRYSIFSILILLFPLNICLSQQKSETYTLKDTAYAKTCYDSAGFYYKKADYNNARRLYMQSLEIFKSLYGERNKKVYVLYRKIGFVEGELGNSSLELNYQMKSLNISKELFGEISKETAGAYGNIGIAYTRLENFDKAEYYLLKTKEIFHQLLGEESNEVAACYNNLGNICYNKNDLDKAAEYHKKALAIRQKILPPNHEDLAACYNNLADVYAEKGDFDLGIEYEKKGLVIKQVIYGETHPAVAWSYNNIGSSYKDKNDFKKALFYHNKALEIRLKVLPSDHGDIVASYMNISNVYKKMAKLDTSLYYQYKALKSGVKLVGTSQSTVASIYFNLGGIYYDKSQYDSAIINYKKSIDINKKIFSRPNSQIALYHEQLAEVYIAEGRPNMASEILDSAILYNLSNEKAGSMPDSSMLSYVLSHKTMSLILLQKGRVLVSTKNNTPETIKKSLVFLQEALSEAQKARFEVTSENSKLYMGEDIAWICENAINELFKLSKLLNDPDFTNKAFYYSEKSKASVLFETLASARTLKQAGVPENVIQKERNYRSSIASYETKRLAISGNETTYFGENIDSILFALKLTYKQYFDSITKSYPLISLLKQESSILDINELKKELPVSTALIEYFTGKEKSYAFVITPDKQSFIELPTDTSLSLRVKKFLIGIRKNNPELTFTNGHWLYTSLIGPFLTNLTETKNLLIIPDQALSSIPFEALISGGNVKKPSYLIEKYCINYQNSASIWHDKSKLLANKNNENRNTNDFIGFAPVFKSNNQYALTTQRDGFIERYGGDTAFFESLQSRSYFKELPNTDKEVNEIAKLFNNVKLKANVFTYEQATKYNFEKEGPNCNILHIATHAYADNDDPELSWLAFSKTDSSDNKMQDNNGILYAGEIYGLSLHANLVVLSACETGIGKVMKGEGVMSLSRSMMYAGVPNIIISLWKVGDLDTKFLMVAFYKAYLSGKKYADALRTAKLEILKKEPTKSKSWAGFVLFGI